MLWFKDHKMKMEKYLYQCWEGGPHIILPFVLRSCWKGYEGQENPLDTSHDYGRACAIEESFAFIQVGDGQGLVLGQSPPMVAVLPKSSSKATVIDLFILRSWSSMDLDFLLDETLKKAELKNTGKSWDIQDNQLGMYYAGDNPLEPIAGEIRIPCQNGAYELWTFNYKSEIGEVLMIRLLLKTS